MRVVCKASRLLWCCPYHTKKMVEPNNDNEKFRIPDLIIKKRNGQKLSKDEIDFFVESVVSGHVQESQIGKHVFFFFSGTSLTKFYHAMFFFLSNVRRIFSFIFKCNFFYYYYYFRTKLVSHLFCRMFYIFAGFFPHVLHVLSFLLLTFVFQYFLWISFCPN